MEVATGEVVLCSFYFSDFKQSKLRPVLVLKNNLPHNDFLGIAISSKTNNLFSDEMLITTEDFDSGSIPKTSKIMLRKTFVISKSEVSKVYGKLKNESLKSIQAQLCDYLGCH